MTYPTSIILVDDEPDTRDTLATIFEDEGFRVVACQNGAEATECFQSRVDQPGLNVVVSDLYLPDMNGLDVLSALKRIQPDVEFILISGYGTLDTAIEAVNQGAFAYQLKPLDIDALIGNVRNAVDHQRLLVENRNLVQQLRNFNAELESKNVELERESAAKTLILSTASHELKTPLTSIVGYVDRMLVQQATVGPLTERQQKYLETVRKNSYRLKVLIDDLLDISSIESGGLRLNRVDLDIQREVREVISSIKAQIDQKGLNLILNIPLDLPRVKADKLRFSQIVSNLLSNACKYSPIGGSVTIAAKDRRGLMQIEVSDSGIGISENDKSKLFAKFFRADNSLTHEVSGTGLGLFIAKSMVEAHRGRIWVESKEGKGSTFSFVLPLEQPV